MPTGETLTIECCAQKLREVIQWLDKKKPDCHGEIIKYNCQDNTVYVTINFSDKMSLIEFQLTF